jgi:putative transposase
MACYRSAGSGSFVGVPEPDATAQEFVETPASADDQSAVEWRQQLAERLLAKAQTDGVRLVGPDGLLAGVTKAVLETALQAELSQHLGYEKGDAAGRGAPNQRNGSTPKTVHTDLGPVRIEVPRDRAGSFEPQIVPKNVRRLGGPGENWIWPPFVIGADPID